MTIKINDIPPEGLTLNIEETLDLNMGGDLTAFSATLNISPMPGEAFHISGRVKSSPVLECSRCLMEFAYDVDTEFYFELAPASGLKGEQEHELERSELDMEFYIGDEIDVQEIVRGQILLALPMVPIHSEDCKGLCPVCGTDLNTADCGCKRDMSGKLSPFAALKDIFKK